MKELSRIAQKVQASTTLAIDAKFKQMLADGIDVVGFGAGEPDFATPQHIKEAGIAAIRDNFTKYTPAAGIMELRTVVAQRMKADYGLEYQPSQIIVSSGAKHILYAALRAMVNPGDEIIIPAPYWVTYCEMAQMVGGTPVVITAGENAHFKITAQQLEAAVTEKTKVVMLNNPSNPTGMLYSKAELEALTQVCVEHDLYILADEIYDKLLYDGRTFTSIPTLGDEVAKRTVLVNGVSKTYAMTGWRIGYAAAPVEIAKIMSNYLSHATGSVCSAAQKAAVAALQGPQEEIEVMRQAFESRRNVIVERMNQIPDVSCIMPDGAFYVMMNVEKLIGRTIQGCYIGDGDDFAKAFLEKGLVAVVPGAGFGTPNFVRWSYATSLENIHKGLDRLEKFLAE